MAAEDAYNEEVFACGMEEIYIGEYGEYYSKEEWIKDKIDEWIERGQNECN